MTSSIFALPARVSVKPPDGNARSAAIVNNVCSEIDCGPTIGGGGAGIGGGGGGGAGVHAARISAATEKAAVAMARLLIMVDLLD
jgi:hypothetical protein